MDTLPTSLLLGALSGATIPLGAWLATRSHFRSNWLETEFRHSVIAFGGGVLLAAVSLVLVPEGARNLPVFWIAACFAGGGLLFFWLDRLVQNHGGSVAQLLAMLLDYIPESLALGAAIASGEPIVFLLAMLIALQNLPEGFNAFREITDRRPKRAARVLVVFSLLPLVGVISAFIGHQYLVPFPETVGGMMLVAAGGIIYLTFEDIAPQAVLKHHWAPPLGAVAGFLVGLIGQALLA